MDKGICVWKVDKDKRVAKIGCTNEVVRSIDSLLPFDSCPKCGNEVEIFEEKVYERLIPALESDEVRDHRYVTEELTQIFKKKNLDYGNAFEQSLDKHGMIASIVRMEDKLNRLTNLYDQDTTLVDESLEDTVMDLANYAIMTAMWIKDNMGD